MRFLIVVIVLIIQIAFVNAATNRKLFNVISRNEEGHRRLIDLQPEGTVPGVRRLNGLVAEIDQEVLTENLKVDGELEVVLPDESVLAVKIMRTNGVMSPELAAKFPEIKAYDCTSLDPNRHVRCLIDYSPSHGFHMLLEIEDGKERRTVYVDPFNHMDTTLYTVSDASDRTVLTNKAAGDSADEMPKWSCGVVDAPPENRRLRARQEEEHMDDLFEGIRQRRGLVKRYTKRTFRFAVAASIGYSVFHGNTPTSVLAAIVTMTSRVSAIFHRELAYNLVLIGTQERLIEINDGILAENLDAFDQVQGFIDTRVGNGAYDIGHVVNRNGGGVAFLGCVCRSGTKARGLTGADNPTNDAFHVDYVAHEVGHQLGAPHTFNGDSANCASNRNNPTAYEPGAGSTIMSYAGICANDNFQNFAHPYFHSSSLIAISEVRNPDCGTARQSTIDTPFLEVSCANFRVPRQTPFFLTALTDNSNVADHTWSWEQYDSGRGADLQNPADTTTGPLFRSLQPQKTPRRYFPELSDVMSGLADNSERLPTLARSMNFKVTVRNAFTGQQIFDDSVDGFYEYRDLRVTVTNDGRFKLDSLNNGETITEGANFNFAWSVQNQATTIAVTAAIAFSYDQGDTWNHVVASNLDFNAKQASVSIPKVPGCQAGQTVTGVLAMMYSTDNPNCGFFDVTDQAFRITCGSGVIATSAPVQNPFGTGFPSSDDGGGDTLSDLIKLVEDNRDLVVTVGAGLGAAFILWCTCCRRRSGSVNYSNKAMGQPYNFKNSAMTANPMAGSYQSNPYGKPYGNQRYGGGGRY